MSKPKVIAFYLPQYHPVKENNEWFGEGFTEWTNVAKAKPLFKGHDQPRVPRDLGFYDLRLPEVREKQAELAKEAGIDAFCYYHYWFGNGKVILEMPLKEVIRLKEPDFPFCICWANHSWYKKNWNPDIKRIEQNLLLEQTYPGDDDIIQHFNYLLTAFKDDRYLKVEGRLLFVIYNIKEIPNFSHFKELWNKLANMNGLPEFYFLSYTTRIKDVYNDEMKLSDGIILALHSNIQYHPNSLFGKYWNYIKYIFSEITHKPALVYKYKDAINYFISPTYRQENVIPVIIPNWDYSPRRGAGGLILKNATPDLFAKHACMIFNTIKHKKESKQIVFLKSWNEWGEGNYMEPDLTYGKGYIYALRNEIDKL